MFKIMWKSSWRKKNNETEEMIRRSDSIRERNVILEKRVKEVEDKYTRDSGITIRNDITKVISKYSKVETIIMLVGVKKLMSESKSIEDSEAYFKLIKKLQSYIDDMTEEE